VPTGVSDEGGNYTTLTLTELPNYLSKRAYDVVGGHRYTQVEQTVIARDLAGPVADAGVAIVTDPGGGQLRDRSYEYLEGESRAALLTNLSQVLNGPEFRAEYSLTGAGQPACTLRIAYPRVGSAASALTLAVPGAAIGYRAAWDSDELRTRTFSVGDVAESAPEGTPKPVIIEDRPQAGLPRLDGVDDWPQTYLTSTLRERANASATSYATPALDLAMTATLAAPPPGSYGVGDDVAVRLVTPLLPEGFEVPARLTEVTVSAGEGTATWTVAIKSPSPRPRATLTQRLHDTSAAIAAAHRRRLTIIP
jgi:hypothetical protein